MKACEEKMLRLVEKLHAKFAVFLSVEQAVKANMRRLSYGG